VKVGYNSVKLSKGISRKVIVDEKGVKDLWKECMEKLMNEQNEWDHGISVEVKEGPADCISRRISEVVAPLKKIKKHKAPGLSGLAPEMIQAKGGIRIRTQWLFDLCNGILKEGCIPQRMEVKCGINSLQRER